jgi:hypothetical protein
VKSTGIVPAVAASGWACVGLIRSSLRPGLLDSSKWYDRALRLIGGLLMGCLSIGIVVVALTGNL